MCGVLCLSVLAVAVGVWCGCGVYTCFVCNVTYILSSDSCLASVGCWSDCWMATIAMRILCESVGASLGHTHMLSTHSA